jgi:hypothetical protein
VSLANKLSSSDSRLKEQTINGMSTTIKNSKRVEALMSLLHSTKTDEVIGALKKIPDQGNASLVKPLLRTFLAWPDEADIQAKIEKILGELKTQDAIPELISALQDDEFDELRAMIISVFWHAGIYPTNELDVLISSAIKGDFMVAVEVVTVIENSDELTDSDLVQESMLDIEEFLDENPEAPHASVLEQLKAILKSQYNL